jgi:6-pyruvoyltetrahydropterin/6-carboxytetrahydropterin synthase
MVTVFCRCKDDQLDENGMVIDFTKIKKVVNRLDHCSLNTIIPQPTAENIAKYLVEEIPLCFKVEIEETRGNKVIYEPDCD